MSPLRTTTLVLASVLSALSTVALIDVVDGGTRSVPDSLVIVATCSSLAAWICYVALTVRDRICGRLDDIEARLDDYGDQREANGYFAHIRDSSNTGPLHRVK